MKNNKIIIVITALSLYANIAYAPSKISDAPKTSTIQPQYFQQTSSTSIPTLTQTTPTVPTSTPTLTPISTFSMEKKPKKWGEALGEKIEEWAEWLSPSEERKQALLKANEEKKQALLNENKAAEDKKQSLLISWADKQKAINATKYEKGKLALQLNAVNQQLNDYQKDELKNSISMLNTKINELETEEYNIRKNLGLVGWL